MDWSNVDNGGCAPACIISSLQDFFSALLYIPVHTERQLRLEDAISITPYIRSEAEDVRGRVALTQNASGGRHLGFHLQRSLSKRAIGGQGSVFQTPCG